jgi:adenosylhomocysteine nucleosidase
VPIAILSALEVEITSLLDSAEGLIREDLAGWSVWRGRLVGREVILAHSGLGKVNTAALTALIWERDQPDSFIFTGVAGALDPALAIGDIVVAERTIQHDAGVITDEGLEIYQAGHVPFFNPTDEFGYRPPADLLDTVRAVAAEVALSPVLDHMPTIILGTIVTGDVFVVDPATRDRLRDALGAQAVEMEGAALAQVSSRLGIDHLVIRAISDLAGEEAIDDFDRFLPEVAANSTRLVTALVERLENHDRDRALGS